jgi:hypothetical protein
MLVGGMVNPILEHELFVSMELGFSRAMLEGKGYGQLVVVGLQERSEYIS